MDVPEVSLQKKKTFIVQKEYHYATDYEIVLSMVTAGSVIAVCTCRLVMISIERSETAQKSILEIRDKFSLRQNAV